MKKLISKLASAHNRQSRIVRLARVRAVRSHETPREADGSPRISAWRFALKIANLLLILAILFVLTFETFLLAQAAGHDSASSAAPSASSSESTSSPTAAQNTSGCSIRMLEFIKIKKREFGTFMNSTFQQPQATSESITFAIDRLRQYKNDLAAEAGGISPPDNRSPTQANEELSNCADEINADFKDMAGFVRQHILATAYAKKTTLLLAKYRQINEKLSKLNFTIGQMYGYFGSFAQQISCFATKCTKG